MKNLIDIHGQMDNQSLLEQDMHIKFLDNFIGDKITNLKSKYSEYYNRFHELEKELKSNFGDDIEKQRKLDLLKYQLNEIDIANLQMGEDVELEDLREKMVDSEKVKNSLNEVYLEIGENTVDYVSNAIRALEKIESLDIKYGETLNTLKGVYYDLQELSRDVQSFSDEMEFDEEERARVENRLDLIHDLKRKYGKSIDEILQYENKINEEINIIENSEERVLGIKKEMELNLKSMKELSIKMNDLRTEYSKVLSKKVNEELIDLEMPNAEFLVHVKFNNKEEYYKDGQDIVEFLISTNFGEEKKSLIKIASGGEMSRIMLAIKNVLADIDEVPIMVFDEIDTGISGKAAKKVGEKLKQISKKHQVICITHQPNIAAKGDYNYFISKIVEEGRTLTNIQQLDEEETIKEIARIATGEFSQIALDHARELRAS